MAFVQRKGASVNLKYPPLYFRVWNNIALLRNNSNQKATTSLLFVRTHDFVFISWKYLLYLPFGHPTSRPLGHHHWRNIRGCTPDAPSWCITPNGANQMSLRKTTPSLQWWCTGKTCEGVHQRFPLGGAWLLVILVCTKWSTPNVTGA